MDGVIESLMLYAIHNGATNSQLGRIYQIANNVAGMLRGEANGVMYSQFDASAANPSVLYSDSVANNTRDGNDQVDFLDISGSVNAGTFVLQVTNQDTGATATRDDHHARSIGHESGR